MMLPSFENSPPPSLLSQGHFSIIPVFHEKKEVGERRLYIV